MTRVRCSLEDAVAAISWAPVETDRVVSLNVSVSCCSSTDRVQSKDSDLGIFDVTRSTVMSMLMIGASGGRAALEMQ
jgi:hypothetical protein